MKNKKPLSAKAQRNECEIDPRERQLVDSENYSQFLLSAIELKIPLSEIERVSGHVTSMRPSSQIELIFLVMEQLNYALRISELKMEKERVGRLHQLIEDEYLRDVAERLDVGDLTEN